MRRPTSLEDRQSPGEDQAPGDMFAAGADGDRRLKREISAVLLFKLAAITVLWYLFFGPTHTVTVTPTKVDARLFSAPPSSPPASRPGS